MDILPSIEYIAGFFDGEGGVGITGRLQTRSTATAPSTGKKVHHIKWRHYSYLTNTDKDILLRIQSIFPGKIETTHHGDAYKTCYRLLFCGDRNRRFLAAISPHVFIKKARIELCMEFLDTLSVSCPKLGDRYRNTKVPYETQVRRYEMYQKMLLLNAKGTKPAPVGALAPPVAPAQKHIPCIHCGAPVTNRGPRKDRPKCLRPRGVCRACYLSRYAGHRNQC